MEKLSMCRICLIKDVRLHCIVNTDLQEIYEILSGNLLETKDRRPLHVCYMCCAKLGNCLRLRTACLHSEELFSLNSCEVKSSQNMMSKLQTIPVIHMSVDPVVHRELNIHPSPTTDEQPNEDWDDDLPVNIIQKGICTQQDVKSELTFSSQDKDLDYSIQNIDVESNSASDNSLENGTPESYVSKSNRSISSVDWKDILGDKTVKIVLHRMDLNSFRKAATITELNPTDLEHTSQCNNLNYSENVEMLKSTICEEYKQIVHTSSETHCTPNNDSFKYIRTQNKKKPFGCPTCDKCFHSIVNLTIHIRSHTGERPFMCDTCGKGFTAKYKLSDHTRIHTGEKPYKCDTCGKCFTLMTNLSRHISVHTGGKPYKCDTCGKCFRIKRSLPLHFHTHTDEKPYKCDTCGKCFRQRTHLSYHSRKHR